MDRMSGKRIMVRKCSHLQERCRAGQGGNGFKFDHDTVLSAQFKRDMI